MLKWYENHMMMKDWFVLALVMMFLLALLMFVIIDRAGDVLPLNTLLLALCQRRLLSLLFLTSLLTAVAVVLNFNDKFL